jgi:hypothetical protein
MPRARACVVVLAGWRGYLAVSANDGRLGGGLGSRSSHSPILADSLAMCQRGRPNGYKLAKYGAAIITWHDAGGGESRR